MKRMQEKYRDQGLQIVWIGFQDKESDIITYAKKMGIPDVVGYDGDNKIGFPLGIIFGDGAALVNRKGIVTGRFRGAFLEDALEKEIAKVLK